MVDYVAYSASNVRRVGKQPLLIGSDSASAATGVAETLDVRNVGVVYLFDRGRLRDEKLSPRLIIQFSPGHETFTYGKIAARIFPHYTSSVAVNPTTTTDSVFFVDGVKDLGLGTTEGEFYTYDDRGLKGVNMGSVASLLVGAESEEEFTRAWEVADIVPLGVAFSVQVAITYTQTSGGNITGDLAAWVVGV